MIAVSLVHPGRSTGLKHCSALSNGVRYCYTGNVQLQGVTCPQAEAAARSPITGELPALVAQRARSAGTRQRHGICPEQCQRVVVRPAVMTPARRIVIGYLLQGVAC